VDLTDLTDSNTQVVYAGGAIGLILLAVYIQRRRAYVSIAYNGQMLPPIAPQYAGAFNSAMSRPPSPVTSQMANAFYRQGMPAHAVALQTHATSPVVQAFQTAGAIAQAAPQIIDAGTQIASAITDLTGSGSDSGAQDDGS
jgi:hypothetical protein